MKEQNNLPELPAPAGTMQMNWGTPYQKDVDAYTEAQVRGYALAAIEAAEAYRNKRAEPVALTDDREAAYSKWIGWNIKYIVEKDFWPWLETAFKEAFDMGLSSAPQVPEALPITEYTTATPLETQMAERQYAHGWNACREAMLSVAPQPEQKG